MLDRRPVLVPAALLVGGAVLLAVGILVGRALGEEEALGGILIGLGGVSAAFGLGAGLATLIAHVVGKEGEDEDRSNR